MKNLLLGALIASIIWLSTLIIASLLYNSHNNSPEVLVISQDTSQDGTYYWMSKKYLENRQKSTRYTIPTKRVLVMFE